MSQTKQEAIQTLADFLISKGAPSDIFSILEFVTKPEAPPQMVGWMCPKCGRGNAPTTTTCICTPFPQITITCQS